MRFIVFLTLFFLVSCSSAKKRAIELSEKGHFEEAIVEWEKALKDDPKDAEALEGLVKSREMAINTRLVQLRNLRNSNEHIRALDSLKALVELQKKWNYKQDVNSAAFQGKETALLWNPFKTEVTARIKKGHALSSAAMYEDFRDIFAFVPKGELDNERAKIFAAGKKSCRNFKDSVSYPYLSSFHNRYCDYFGVDKTSKVIYNNVFGNIHWMNDMQGLPNDHAKFELINKMTSAFAETPWYLKTSKAEIRFHLTGSLTHKTRSEVVPQVQEYYEQEPYTSYEQVKKTRVNSLGQSEDYYENEQVTRYRSVRKEFDYNATKLSQTIALIFESDFDLVKKKHTVGLEKNFDESIVVHDYNMPNIDLHPPKKKNLESVGSLWGKYTEEIGTIFKAKLIKIWEAEYCVLPEVLNHALVSENVLRCRKSASAKNTDFVNTWFLNNYGIPNSTVEKVLGDF